MVKWPDVIGGGPGCGTGAVEQAWRSKKVAQQMKFWSQRGRNAAMLGNEVESMYGTAITASRDAPVQRFTRQRKIVSPDVV
jgi:hypothetical protein